ncbi:MAG TPA: isoprenylcysteine carboxylmethyltransferase family protein [Patescibacteria group bacterium]|nr:isoprenylcysteine carboxylmethyltransferase family protein [Patescibacteria group bacterium]
MRIKSFLLVFFQLLFLFLFFATGPVFANNYALSIVELAAIILGVWAIIHMKRNSKFSGFPTPAEQAKLLHSGPYQYIRNPMYTAWLLVMGVLLLDFYTPIRLVIYILEIVVLLTKISIEEKLLTEKFTDYAAYKSRTKRLIPFVY